MSKNNFASYSTSEELASSFNTDLKNGLVQSECDSRLRLYGLNEFSTKESPTKILIKFFEQFKNPLLQLLLLSVVISVCMSQYDDAISISLALVIVITVAFVQEYRSEQSLRALNKLVPPSAKVIRGGVYQEILAKYVVPGDIALISTGDRVPADLRLIDCQDLGIDESNMTGETELSMKNCATRRPAFRYNPSTLGNKNNDNNNNNLHANGKVNNNNNETSIDIYNNNDNYIDNGAQTNKCESRASADLSNSESSENLAYMGTLVQSGHGRGLVIGTSENTQFGNVFKMMQSEESPKSPLQQNMDQLGSHLSIYSLCVIFIIVIVGWLQSRPIVEVFTIGVSLAVAAIPEGLPIVVTVTLALGVVRMAKKNAVVKQLSAVETLGCVRVICSDKTGTLTKNEMTVNEVETAEGYGAKFTGVGYDDRGEVILRNLSLNQEKQMSSIRRLFTAACLCNNARFDSTHKLIGQATEGAILIGARKLGLSDPRDEYQRLEEIPFSSKYKYMAVKCIPNDATDGNNSFYLKGALDVVLEKCRSIETDKGIEKLDQEERIKILRSAEFYENQSLRVIAIASGSAMDNLKFLGLIGIYDAPRLGVRNTIEILANAGVEVKMVTGDSRNTALSIAKMVGIGSNSSLASMSGHNIDGLYRDSSLSKLEKAERMSNVSVFYRVTPSHKVIIVKMLQLLGNVTAMTGDGVNDSVALKKADIGIAMGSTGTDVCKEAAAVILMDDNLGTLVGALEEGKGIFYNIRNFIKFQLSTSIAALSLIATTTLLHIPSPFNAMQILYINILMDGPPAQSLGVETVSQDVLMQPPRNVKEPVLSRNLLIDIVISATVIYAGTLLVFIVQMSDGVVTPRDTSMTFTCFVLFDLFNAMSCRSQTKLIFEMGFFTNKAFLWSIFGSLVGQILVIYCPPFQMIFQTEALSFLDILTLLMISSSVFVVSESVKLFKNRGFKRRFVYKTSMYLV